MKSTPDILDFIRKTLDRAAELRREAELLEATARGAQIALGIDGEGVGNPDKRARLEPGRRAGRQPGTVTSAGKAIMQAVHSTAGSRFTIDDYKASAERAGHPQRRPSEIVRKFQPYLTYGMLRQVDDQTFEITAIGFERFEIAKGSDGQSEPLHGGDRIVSGGLPNRPLSGLIPDTSTLDPSGTAPVGATRSDTNADEGQLWSTDLNYPRKAGGT